MSISEVDCTGIVRKRRRVQRTVDHRPVRSRVHQAASCSGVVCTIAGGDVVVDRHRCDAAGLGNLGHGELAGVVHALGLVDQRWGHLPDPAGSPPLRDSDHDEADPD